MSGGPTLVASGSQTVGPFFHVGPAASERFGVLAAPGVSGERITVRVLVLDAQGAPVPDALVELWQADADGRYSSPPASPPAANDVAPAFTGFGRLGTRADGSCAFETIRPGRVGEEAAHINVTLFARGLLRQLYTRIYFDGDPALADDPILSIVEAGRRGTLLARQWTDGTTWDFVIRLQGDGETVFFDL